MTAPTEHPDTPERVDPETGEVLDSDAPDNGGWDRERHCITDLRGADWAGRKLREAEEQARLNAAMFEAELAELQRKVEDAEKRLAAAQAPFGRTIAFFLNALTVYALNNRAEVLKGLRTKSRLLPCGVRVGWEKKGGNLRLQETPDARERLIAWARGRYPETVEQRWEVDVNAVRRAVGTATTPDGMERVPESESLTVTTKGEK